MFITFGVQLLEYLRPWENPITGDLNVDGAIWFDQGRELYSEYQFNLEVLTGDLIIEMKIRPDDRELAVIRNPKMRKQVIWKGYALRRQIPNVNAIRLIEREVTAAEHRAALARPRYLK